MNTSPIKLACWLAAAACANAHAQSGLEVYGLIDVNLGVTSNFAEDGDSVVRVSSHGMNTSRLGFRGGEDLVDGLKAVYQLEIGIVPDTGAADTPLFKRQANVGVEGRYGRLVVGRSFTAVYDFMQAYEPMSYAPFYSWAPTGNASGASKYGMTFAFDNMVKYSGKFGNFTVGANYGAGERSASSDGARTAFALNYATAPYGLVATWERANGNASAPGLARDVTSAWHLGSFVNVGKLKLQAAMRDYRHKPGKPSTPDVRARLYWTGASYLVTPLLTVTGALYYQDVRNVADGLDADPTMLVGRLRCALSRRTDLYLTTAYTRAKHGLRVSLARDDVGYGDSQRGTVIGIQHRF